MEHECNEGAEQILPVGHSSAQLPAGLTHSSGLQENHWYPAWPALARLLERGAIQLCGMLACPSKFQIGLGQRQNCTRHRSDWDGGKDCACGYTVCSLVMLGLSYVCFCNGVVCLWFACPLSPEWRHSCGKGTGNSCKVPKCLS